MRNLDIIGLMAVWLLAMLLLDRLNARRRRRLYDARRAGRHETLNWELSARQKPNQREMEAS